MSVCYESVQYVKRIYLFHKLDITQLLCQHKMQGDYLSTSVLCLRDSESINTPGLGEHRLWLQGGISLL